MPRPGLAARWCRDGNRVAAGRRNTCHVAPPEAMFTVEMIFQGDLGGFLRREWRGQGGVVRRSLAERTAVKDVLEVCGVPHSEVDLILAGPGAQAESTGERAALEAVDFRWQVRESTVLWVYPAPAPAELRPNAPRLQTRGGRRFVADGHLGKLVRNLRLLGVDTVYERDADDPRLLEIMAAEDRVLLTRDRPLLMHSVVRHGYCPRSDQHEEQTREVRRRFELSADELRPFSRCLQCNTPLAVVPKAEVLAPLADEPLTLRYYDEFRRCPGCGSIYWPGTHARKLDALVGRLLG